jgi:hypothetical protein
MIITVDTMVIERVHRTGLSYFGKLILILGSFGKLL